MKNLMFRIKIIVVLTFLLRRPFIMIKKTRFSYVITPNKSNNIKIQYLQLQPIFYDFL